MKLLQTVFVAGLSALLCAGCARPPESAAPSALREEAAGPAFSFSEASPSPEESLQEESNCVLEAARAVAEQIEREHPPGIERICAAYEYLIVNTVFGPPVGLDAWRYREPVPDAPLDYLHNRALSPLLFGVGSCEDYAAALTVLLRELGYEAEYLPGLTISVYGGFVDHAWTMVRLDGRWYHLDPQLEQNVMRGGTITYRYFLKSDETMMADHRWGESMIRYGGLTEEQVEEVEADYLMHPCPVDGPARAPKQLPQPGRPDRFALERQLAAERRSYEAEYGPLPDLELEVIPPVFGEDGYGINDDF
ncbi:hypothetical protein H8711_06970 [Clostridiaceae bacterium NSJ-31]|uniref:Transglutaminase-like domain-containing protein n=1 Tax=Ligaoa zhengdingensis TaxID=2763658 RepID=A0A926DXM7_9FIRM|nr:transglutaminase domain-containing protein [Ligaoa zhengdingensis]MBC8546676.1 hypothetical protein [Ligaoa zhengdingensis]